jgi:Ricin-type beta-trefoil lectin domain-like
MLARFQRMLARFQRGFSGVGQIGTSPGPRTIVRQGKENMFNRRRIIALLFAGATIAGVSLASAQASNASAVFVIRNFGSQKCIQTDPAFPGQPDIQLVQEDCNPADPAQQWIFDPIGGGLYHIVNVGNGLCMRARTNTDFAQVQTIDCTGISDEKWSLNGLFTPLTVPATINSKISGGNRCLDVLQGSHQDNAKIDIFHCTSNNTAQLFTNS